MINVKNGPLYQWDINRVVEIENAENSISEVHCCREDDTVSYVLLFEKKGNRSQTPNLSGEFSSGSKNREHSTVKVMFCPWATRGQPQLLGPPGRWIYFLNWKRPCWPRLLVQGSVFEDILPLFVWCLLLSAQAGSISTGMAFSKLCQSLAR